jgi:hypothetical protein
MYNCKLWYLKTIVFQNCISKQALSVFSVCHVLGRKLTALAVVCNLLKTENTEYRTGIIENRIPWLLYILATERFS